MEEQSGGSFFITPLQGTYLLGATNAFFSLVPLYTINKLGRRTHYILGQLFMAVFLFICGYAALKEENILSFVSLCAFFMSSTLSQAVINWLYIAEVTVDAAAGFCVAGKSINLLIVSFSFEYMINSPLLIHGTIWYYSAVTFVGFIFCLFFVKETMGLTENEKKTLYSPKSDFDIDVFIEM